MNGSGKNEWQMKNEKKGKSSKFNILLSYQRKEKWIKKHPGTCMQPTVWHVNIKIVQVYSSNCEQHVKELIESIINQEFTLKEQNQKHRRWNCDTGYPKQALVFIERRAICEARENFEISTTIPCREIAFVTNFLCIFGANALCEFAHLGVKFALNV